MNVADFTLNEKFKNMSNLLSIGFSYLNTTQIDNTTESVFLPTSIIYSNKERHTHGQGRALTWFYAMNWALSSKQSWGDSVFWKYRKYSYNRAYITKK